MMLTSTHAQTGLAARYTQAGSTKTKVPKSDI